tara:strand:- start:289 stop:456 length:168 start_codon:yes stop_codon:yes gene_type:complete
MEKPPTKKQWEIHCDKRHLVIAWADTQYAIEEQFYTLKMTAPIENSDIHIVPPWA